MSALPPESFVPAARLAVHPAIAVSRPGGGEAALAARWAAVLEAAALIAALAGHPAAPVDGAVRAFPAAVVQAGGQRLAVARQSMEDLSVILETGLRALLSVHASGAGCRAAAEALLEEFCGARNALLALLPPARRALA